MARCSDGAVRSSFNSPASAPGTPRQKSSNTLEVSVRIRPLSDQSGQSSIEVCDGKTISVSTSGDRYTFNRVFGPETSQSNLFEQCTKPLLESSFEKAQDTLIMAYGITNAGKSYTMQGTEDNPGLTSRTLDFVFDQISLTGRQDAVLISYLEIYNEKVHDLLNDAPNKKQRPDLKLMPDVTGRMSVQGLKEVQVSSAQEGRAVLAMGQSKRQTSDTNLNAVSSRSHAVFSIKVVDKERCVKFSLVDLAGSERAGRTQNQGAKLKEAAKINNSLMALGQCFEALRWNQAHPNNPKMVPFRNCKITRLFQELLSGNGRVAMVLNVNPQSSDIDETCHALRYASVAREIQLTPKVDSRSGMRSSRRTADPDPELVAQNAAQAQLINELWEEIEELKAELLATHTHSANIEIEIRDEVCAQMGERLGDMESAHQMRILEEQVAITSMYETKITAMAKHHQAELALAKRSGADDASEEPQGEEDADGQASEAAEAFSEEDLSPCGAVEGAEEASEVVEDSILPEAAAAKGNRRKSTKRKSAEFDDDRIRLLLEPQSVTETSPTDDASEEPEKKPAPKKAKKKSAEKKPVKEAATKVKRKVNREMEAIADHMTSPAQKSPAAKKLVRAGKKIVLSPAVQEALQKMQEDSAPVRRTRATRSCRNAAGGV